MAQSKGWIAGERVSIRKLSIFDLRDVYTNMKDPEVGRWRLTTFGRRPQRSMVRFFHGSLRSVWRVLRFLSESVSRPGKRRELKLGVVLKETGRVIGVVTLGKVDRQQASAEIGFWIAKKYWRRGLATEAVKLALDFAFSELKLDRIYAWTFECNAASIRVMQKCGFTTEQMPREIILESGEGHNIIDFGVLRSEYEN
jgi:RimJ/RimL family protein N-acetyltransferase